MQIQTNTDNTIELHEPLAKHVESVVKESLSRFSEHITRVEVHLGETSDKKSTSGDHRCLMEARLENHPPIAASDHASSLHQAIHGAAEKLKRSIDSTLGRIKDSNKGSPIVAEAGPEETEETEER
ncbi:MAG: ribosomal subunit interface protein [Burkholderia sp.]|jgi:ribosomal subunit interface protein|nr:ribosomal subunit interface protein [Burkholderia sp.]